MNGYGGPRREKHNIVYVIPIFHLQKYVFSDKSMLPNSGYFKQIRVSDVKKYLPILRFFC